MLGCKLAAVQQESSPKLNIILRLLKLLIAFNRCGCSLLYLLHWLKFKTLCIKVCLLIDHFTVLYSVTTPLNKSCKAGVDLIALIQTHSFSYS